MTDESISELPPNILYHYTDQKGLLGIIETGELWLSDIRFVNDSREYIHAGELLGRTVDRVAKEWKKKYIDIGIREETFDRIGKNIKKHLVSLAKEHRSLIDDEVGPRDSTFVFCLSEERDLLSQWRAYGRGQYCVGLKSADLDTAGMILKKVHYFDGEDSEGAIHHAFAVELEDFFKRHCRFDSDAYPDEGISMETVEDGIDEFRQIFREREILASVKDEGFAEEKEWRIIKPALYDDENIDFVCGTGRYIRPILKVGFQNGASDKIFGYGSFIEEVITGPGIEPERSGQSLKAIKKRFGMDFRISHSRIPYRSD